MYLFGIFASSAAVADAVSTSRLRRQDNLLTDTNIIQNYWGKLGALEFQEIF